MKTARFLVFLLVFSSLPVNAFAQTAATAKISGVVTDAQGAVVQGATVKLINKATKQERTDATNDEGRYVFAAIDPGLYDVTATAQGFRTTVVSDFKAEISKAASIDITLQPGGVGEQVTITAAGEVQLQKEDSSVGNVIEADRITRLPTQQRQVTELLRLQPLTTTNGETAGSRFDQNTFTLDGIDVTDNVGFRGGFATVVPTPTESIEEFRVTVANPNASFGRSAGAQVVLVTKRGGNAFHGSAYAYHQNDNLNANSWTNNRLGLDRPPLIDNRFGFSVGGPIWPEKLFFFTNYEGRRLPGTTQATRVVPTESFRNGTLRFRDTSGNILNINPRTFDPRGIGASPAILSYLRALPAPNNFSGFGDGLNTAGFTANIPANLESDYGVLRLDYQITQNWSFEAKGALYRNIQRSLGQVDLIQVTAADQNAERPKNLTFGLIGTIRPNLVNEIRIGHAFDNFVLERDSPAGRGGFNVAVNLAPSTFDFNPALALLDEHVDVDTQRAREQSLSGGSTQFIDNATWSKGLHTFQFGGTLRHIKTFHYRDDKVIGSVASPVADIGTAGGVPVPPAQRPGNLNPADIARYNQFYKALLGIVDSVGYLAVRDADLNPTPVGTGLINEATLNHWEFYFADVWKMRPSLTASFGLQYQWHTPPKDAFDRQTVLVFKDTGKLIETREYLRMKEEAAAKGEIFNPDIAYIPIKEVTSQDGVFRINRKNFSPRLSVAWEPSFTSGWLGKIFGEHRTVIRGGYALLYDRSNTVQSVVVPMLGVGFAQTLTARPTGPGGQPFRAGIDGPIPVPANFPVTSPVVPGQPFGEILSFTVDPGIEDPYNHAVNFTIQRELPGKMLLELGYIGRFARNLFQNVNLNSAPIYHKDTRSGQTFAEAFDAVAAALRAGRAASAQPWFENQLFAGATGFLASAFAGDFIVGNINNLWNTGIDILPLLGLPVANGPYNNLQSLDLFVRTSLGRSNYNAFIVSLHKRSSQGLTFDFNYTFGKSIDQIGQIQNFVSQFSSSFDGDIDYGPSDFDFRHIINANGVYDLPFGSGRRFAAGNWVDKLIGGWYVSGIFQASSGLPLTVVQGFQVYGAGAIFGTGTGAIPTTRLPGDNSTHRGVAGSGGIGTAGDPSSNGSGLNLFGNPESVFKSFRPINLASDFRQGRGVLRGLPRWQLDLSLGKQTKITENIQFTFTADFFNIFNHVNYADPTLNLSQQASFGVITNQLINAVLRPRTIQLGARVQF